MPKHEVPPGYALIRLDDLAAMLTAHTGQPPPEPGRDEWSGLGAAVAMLTARLGNQSISHKHLADGIPPEFIIAALLAMAFPLLRNCMEERAAEFLQDMGVLAAARGHGPDGRPL